MKIHYLLFCLLGAALISNLSYADEVNFGKKIPSTEDVIKALVPTAPASPVDTDYEGDIKGQEKTRMIDMSTFSEHPVKAKAKSKVTEKPAVVASNRRKEMALSMEILFGYKSAELTDVAKEQLRPVGEALASEKLQRLDFVVEGHTDAIGSVEYNKVLSEQRAASVREYLASAFHIDSSRMQVVGKGKSDLFDPKNPGSEANRRVRIIANQ